MDRSRFMLDRLPHFWNIHDSESIVGAMVNAIASELDHIDGNIQHIDDMIGVDGTVGKDLDKRWGAMLNIPRRGNESDTRYRNRLKTTIKNMVGGTEDSIRYAVAVATDTDIPASYDHIKIIDAWKYDKHTELDKSYGNAICFIDIDTIGVTHPDAMVEAVSFIKLAKASGTNIHIIWYYNLVDEYDITSSPYNDMMMVSHDDGDEQATIVVDSIDTEVYGIATSDDDIVSMNTGMPEESYTNDISFVTNSTLFTNCKQALDIIKSDGKPDIIL